MQWMKLSGVAAAVLAVGLALGAWAQDARPADPPTTAPAGVGEGGRPTTTGPIAPPRSGKMRTSTQPDNAAGDPPAAGAAPPATPAPPAAGAATRPASFTVPAAATRPVAAAATQPAAGPAPAGAHGSGPPAPPAAAAAHDAGHGHGGSSRLLITMLYVFMLSTFIGIGVIRRVSRLLHTPLMSLTNAISAIAVVGALIIAGGQDYPVGVKVLGAIAVFASMTNIISGFLITDRMLKMFKTPGGKA